MPTRPHHRLAQAATLAGLLGLAASLFALPAQAETLTRTSAFEYDPATGLLVKEIIEPDTPDLCLVTTYTYDAYGNKTSATTRNCNGSSGEAAAPTGDAVFSPRTSSTTYDARGQFPLTSTNALGHSETKTFDARFGAVLSLTGPNGLTTTWQYDGFGRKTQESRADGTVSTWAYQRCVDISGCPSLAQYRVLTTATGSPAASVYYDSLNREIRSETTGFNGTLVRKDTEYDSRGRVARVSSPYYVGDTVQWSVPTYDDLNRVLTQTTPDGAVTSTTYAGLTTTVTISPSAGFTQTKTTIKNSQGQVVRVLDAQNNALDYEYDAFGNLTKTTDALGNQSQLAYDLRGRKTQMVDPDMGTWTYAYNALGELIRQTDAKAQTTTLAYDLLGRMVTRTEPDLTSSWSYDSCTKGTGKLCSVSADNGYSRSHVYDTLGRPSSTTVTVQSVTQTLTTTYDAAGRLNQLTYPTGFAVTYGYNANGYLDTVRKAADSSLIWQATARSATGRTLTELLGNGLTTTRTYDVVDRLTAIQSGNGTATVHHHTYSYDQLGNLTQRIDQTQSVTENFAYDSLNRLTMVSGTMATRSFAYDALGNITYKSDVGNYTYPTPGAGAVRPHAVTQVTGAVNATYTYDANGNLISGNGRTLTYTSYNAPATIANASYSYAYTYNAEHERVRLVTTRPDDTLTSLYFHPDGKGRLFYEREERQSDGRLEHKHYVQAGAELVGVYVTRSDSFAEMRYYHHDHLGSVALITNEAGAPLERLAYEAFGERRYPNGNPQDRMSPLIGITTDRGFTSHEHLDELNLIHMNGRVYDPVLGRFMTADPFIQSPGNLQSYNRYSYVFNNPLAYTDPSGYFSLSKALKKLFKNRTFRTLVAIGVAYFTGFYDFGVAGAPSYGLFGASSMGLAGGAAALGNAMVSGAALSGISAGSWEAAFQGALSGGLFWGAGSIGQGLGFAQGSLEMAALHAVAGCMSASAGGGQCSQGALSAGFANFAGSNLGDWGRVGNLVRNTILGGVAAELAGGKFANGAKTAAFGHLFNDFMHEMSVDGSYSDGTEGTLGTGLRLPGTEAGDRAAQYWAALHVQTGNPLYAVPGVFASLWTPDTATHTSLTLIGGGGASIGIRLGRELAFGNNFRIAPFGNRTGHSLGELPHYHRRGIDSLTGQTRPGQGIGRHRPWETRQIDRTFWDRF
jgi:RHS repeat-associated protein